MSQDTLSLEAVRSALKAQYHAALAMLKETIQGCPDSAWSGDEHLNAPWQIAYHTLFFTHLYLQPNEAAFRPWKGHQEHVQHPDALSGPPDPDSTLPLLPRPYTKAEVLEYWSVCNKMVDGAVDHLDLHNAESGFYWYKVPKLEHQLINLRHLQHGAAQLADRVRAAANVPTRWVGTMAAGAHP